MFDIRSQPGEHDGMLIATLQLGNKKYEGSHQTESDRNTLRAIFGSIENDNIRPDSEKKIKNK